MSVLKNPLVSIVTPVYNGEPYLAECIESVLAQTYPSWDYTIINNCSTDGTLDLAERYAKRDRRIRVHTNDTFLQIMANANKAVSLISPVSKYCKNLSADDWLLPECLTRMVEIAELRPSIGLVGSYQLSGGGDKWYVRSNGLPNFCTVISGREIARAHLLGTMDVLGNPTSNLYRSDLIRRTDSFYPNSTPEADVSACYECLKDRDFGFVHQILSYERLHPGQITNTSRRLNAYSANRIGDLRNYGAYFLAADELESRIEALMNQYYEFLAMSAIDFPERSFWRYHSGRLSSIGYPLDRIRLAKGISKKYLNILLCPKLALERVVRPVGRLLLAR